VFAGNGREALRTLAADHRFDMVLCDVVMPEVDGMQLFERVVRAAPDFAKRFVFVTGGATSPAHERFLINTKNHVFQKPFEMKTIHRLICDFRDGRPN
jgi:CheY-like chemotaxis protein